MTTTTNPKLPASRRGSADGAGQNRPTCSGRDSVDGSALISAGAASAAMRNSDASPVGAPAQAKPGARRATMSPSITMPLDAREPTLLRLTVA